jgi:outer membrane autotransporter protein
LQSVVNGSLTVKSGTISAVGEDCFAIAGFGGEVNVGYDGSSFSSQDVKIIGDIKSERAGKVNLALETPDSMWDGSIYVYTAYDEDYDTDTEFNLWLKNGAIWQNEEKGDLFSDFSDVNHFVGGESFENSGTIKQNLNSRPLKFKNYQGYSIISYPDLQSENLDNNDIIIDKVVSSDSGIALVAEAGTGGDISTEETSKATFNKLANQLSVLDGQDNLEKEVSIKGLTTSTLKITDEGLEFKDNVLQVKDDYQILENDEEQNLYETETMKTFDSVLGSSVLNLRKSISTVIPKHQVEDGIWTRIIRNKLNYDKEATNFTSQTTGIQVGYENMVHKDWSIGAGFSYANGSENFRNLGSGDSKEVDLFLYSNWKNSDDSFLDLTIGHYRFDNEYDFTTDLGYNLIGDYDNKAFAINARVGKVFQHKDSYLTPQIEVSLGHIKSSNQKAQRKDTNENVLDIKQDSMDLLIGKIGFELGKKTKKYDAYFKAMYAKDFSDDLVTTYTALYEDSKKVTKSYNDSWLELELGLCKKISQNGYYNINFEKIIGGDLSSSWQVNTGFNWSF